MYPLICLALASTAGQGSVTSQRVPLESHPLDGTYRLLWDDKIDGQVEMNEKMCDVHLTVEGVNIKGDFLRGLGGGRRATIGGTIASGLGRTYLVSFRQFEPNYACSYQLMMGDVPPVGVWHDTQGRSGDFTLRKYL